MHALSSIFFFEFQKRVVSFHRYLDVLRNIAQEQKRENIWM